MYAYLYVSVYVSVYRYTYLKYCPLQVLPLYLTCTRVCVLVFAHIPGGHQPPAAVPLPVIGGQVLVLVFHHHLQDGF